MQPCNISKQ